jgi:PAS domain S-box-containing protein
MLGLDGSLMTVQHDPKSPSIGLWKKVFEFTKIFLPLAMVLSISFLLYLNAVDKLKINDIKSEERFYTEIAKNHINQDLEFLGSDVLVLAQNERLLKLIDWDTIFHRQALAKSFLGVAKERQLYDQIRYIDNTGMEIIRVNFNAGAPDIVPEEQLQNKANRYYFEESLKLEQGQLYISPFDLNKERGEIEVPFKPMLRIGTPVFDSLGQKQGVIILNYLGARLIERFDVALLRSAGDAMFMNNDGHLFRSPIRSDEWGFMTGNENIFKKNSSEIWRKLSSVHQGQIHTSTGLYTFTTIDPSARVSRSIDHQNDNNISSWKILTHVPSAIINPRKPWKDHPSLVSMFAVLMILSALACAYITIARLNKQRTQQALLESEERYRQIAEISSDWVWEMDKYLRISYLSPAFEKMTGVDPSYLIGKTRPELTRPEELSKESWKNHLADLESRNEFKNFPLKFFDPKGNIRHFSVSGVPIRDLVGRFEGYRGTCSDVTQMVTAENLLKITTERAESANRAKSDFLASMSHELRTPLNSIIGFSQMLKDETFGAVGSKNNQDYVEIINSAGIHLHRLIGDILDLSKIEAGEYELTTAIIDIPGIFDECRTMLGERADKKQVSLSVHHPDECPSVIADELKLKQIILNLLSNAIKFTPSGGKVEMQASIGKKGGMILKVTDTGIGISPEDVPRVTNPFEQTGNVMTRQQEGTGLGLALAKSLAELHDGSLKIESSLGKGTSVILSLPASRTVQLS